MHYTYNFHGVSVLDFSGENVSYPPEMLIMSRSDPRGWTDRDPGYGLSAMSPRAVSLIS